MKVLINLIRIILIGIWGLVLAVGIRLCFDDAVPPTLGDYAPWTVADGAMEPGYAKGDLVILNRKAQAQPGDAVLYRDGSTLVFSRIIGTTEDLFILKADGREETALAENYHIAGVCVSYLPGCGPVVEFLCSLPGIFAVLAAGLVLIILPGAVVRSGKGKGKGPGGPRAGEEPAPRSVQRVQRTSGDAAPRTAGTRDSREAPGTRGRGGYTPRH